MHVSVLLQEAIIALNLKENGIYVDCTLGYAGHSSEILKRIRRGYLFAFDQDRDAISYSEKKLSEIASNYEIIYHNFAHIKTELAKRNISRVSGILFDLGVSSPQLDVESRGFSYHGNARLDMRMDQAQELSAETVVNEYPEAKLVRIFREYGEEKFAGSIARKIVQSRENSPIHTTGELAEIIKCAVPQRVRREKHPARKVFQAIRIEVNQELEVLKTALKDSLDLLEVGGRIAVITFHSLEDRIVKNMFRDYTAVDPKVKGLPNVPEEYLPDFRLVTNKAIVPSDEEIERNYRARCSKLRIIERIK